MSGYQWNSTPTCAGSQPYEQEHTSPNNTCAWRTANYSSSTQAGILSCCGPNNTPYPYSIPNTPPGCFQMCNITNGTYDQMKQNQVILHDCLYQARAGDLSCKGQLPPTSSADGLRGVGGSWVKIGVGLFLIGTVVWGL